MPRSLAVRLVVVLLVVVVGLIAASRINSAKTPTHVEKPVPDNALVH